MLKRTLFLYASILMGLAARSATAAVCVEIDTARDTLSEGDRRAAVILLGESLEQQGLSVADQGCVGIFRVSHVRFGDSVTVSLQGPQGYRQATARGMNDVPALYSQMVHSLLTNQPMNVYNGTVDRTNATAAQQAPNRVEADSLWYLRLGYGGITSPSATGGPSFGFGYRYELDAIAVDLSFLNFVIGENGTTANGSSGSFTGSFSIAKLMGLYFLNPTANSSTYLGGGVSWGGTDAVQDSTSSTGVDSVSVHSGSGLQAELSAGWEFLRASTIRMFVQGDVTLPFYLTRGADSSGATSSSYSPTFALSLGIGIGKSSTRVHIVE
jgi:hypothetical protein